MNSHDKYYIKNNKNLIFDKLKSIRPYLESQEQISAFNGLYIHRTSDDLPVRKIEIVRMNYKRVIMFRYTNVKDSELWQQKKLQNS